MLFRSDYLTTVATSIHYGTAKLDQGFGENGCAFAGTGTSVQVTVQLTYSPFVFDLFSGDVTVSETGTATVATGTN